MSSILYLMNGTQVTFRMNIKVGGVLFENMTSFVYVTWIFIKTVKICFKSLQYTFVAKTNNYDGIELEP